MSSSVISTIKTCSTGEGKLQPSQFHTCVRKASEGFTICTVDSSLMLCFSTKHSQTPTLTPALFRNTLMHMVSDGMVVAACWFISLLDLK